MTQQPTKSVRITHGKVDALRIALRRCPVANLPADASERTLIDAALEIAAGVVWGGDRLPRVYRRGARFKDPHSEPDLVEQAPDELIYVAGQGLMVLTGGRLKTDG